MKQSNFQGGPSGRKVSIIVSILILLWLPSHAEEISMVYTFNTPELSVVNIDGVIYDRIIIPDAPNSGIPNHPSLPCLGATILIPYGMEVADVDIIGDTKVHLGSGFLIEPTEHAYPLSMDPAGYESPIPDPAVYSSNLAYPASRMENIGIQSFRGYQILILKLIPVEYVPASGDLYYYPELKITVSLINTGKSSPLYRGLPADLAEVAHKIDNAEILSSYDSAPKRGAKSYDMLIICPSFLQTIYQMLKDHHDANGLLTEIRTLDDIGGSSPDEIRDYIRQSYLNDGIEYVIIGADDDLIPAIDLYVSTLDEGEGYFDSTMASDIYFACLDGTYNYDGDDLNGEATDGEGGGDVDLLAEVYVGRIPAGSAPEAYAVVAKTLDYIASEDPYLDEVLMAGEHLRFGGFGEYGGYSLDEIIDVSTTHGYTTVGIPSALYNMDKLYDLTWTDNDWPNTEIINRINSGVHIINHYGHCNYFWALKMTTADVITQMNNNKYYFMYTQGCQAGGFDADDCWAEFATVKTDHGAFAGIMNTRYGFGRRSTDGPSQRFNREFLDAIYNPAEAKPQLGRANQDSKEDNLYRINDECMRWCYYQLTLFGDPAISFKSVSGVAFDYPEGLPERIMPETETAFDIAVYGTGTGVPAPGTGQLHYIINEGEVQTVAMVEKTPPNIYEATLPSVVCGDRLKYYISMEESGGARFYDPDPAAPREAMVSEDIDILFEDDFETDKGWTISGGLWQRGIPTGQGAGDLDYPRPDPTEGCSGPNVFGYNLEGDYEPMLPEMYLTGPTINCSNRDNVYLKYWRWLGVEGPYNDHASIEVSNNGTDWVTIWENEMMISDIEWLEYELDISEVAANQESIHIRWVMGPTSPILNHIGWNIDDVRVVSYLCANYVCGDANGSETVNILDITFLINYLYKDGPAPQFPNAANVNNDAAINILDITYLISYLYLEGPEPVCP